MIKFNIAAINRCTEVEGPGKRLTIWFQGCNIHCNGCCNPQYQALQIAHLMTLEELVAIIKNSVEEFGIEGVTYSGGEPTLQLSLPILTEKIKELGLSVISFTGHCYDEVKDVLVGCDAVLDGPFDKTQPEKERRILGSSNQRILPLTDRYPNIDEWFSHNETIVEEFNVGNLIFANGDKI